MTKLELIGEPIEDSTAFDWTKEILGSFNSQSVPVLKRSCFAADTAEFSSFRIVMSGIDDRSNIISESAGPSEYGKCSNARAPVEEHPQSGKIYYTSDRISGIELAYTSTFNTLQIGDVRSNTSVEFTFDEKGSFIGFYGTQATDRI